MRLRAADLVRWSSMAGVLLAAVVSAAPVRAQTCPSLVGIESFGPFNQGPKDVAVKGDYAYTADLYGLTVYHVVDSANPAKVGELLLPEGAAGAAVSGSTAFVAAYDGLRVVVDVSMPSAPYIVENVPTLRSGLDVAVSTSTSTVWLASWALLESYDMACPGCAGLGIEVGSSSVLTGGGNTTVTVTVRDLVGVPTADQLVTATGNLGSVGAFTDNGDGTYDGVFTSGEISGTAEIIANVNGQPCVATAAVEVVCAAGATTVPTGLEITSVTDDSETLVWDTTDNAAAYVVYRRGYELATIDVGTTVTFTDTQLISGTEYCYEVSAVDACGGESDRTAQVCGTTTGVAETCPQVATPYTMEYLNSGNMMSVAVLGTIAATADAYGATIWDVSDPTSPVRLGTANGPNNAGRTVELPGSGLLLMGSDNSDLQVVDVSNPATPKTLGSLDLPTRANSIAIAGSTAFVAGGSSGLLVVDFSDPTAPVIDGSVDTPGTALAVALSGTIAFVADQEGDLQVVDVSHPTTPVIVGSADIPGYERGVAVSGSIIVVANGSGLQVIDATDPTVPTVIGSVAASDGYAYGVAVSGSTVFVADGDAGLQVVDVSDPSAPTILGSVGALRSSREVELSGSTAFVADYGITLQIVDVSDPTAPVIIASFDTPEFASDVVVTGSIAYIVDSRGIQMVDVSDPRSPMLVGSGTTTRGARGVAVANGLAVVAGGAFLDILELSCDAPSCSGLVAGVTPNPLMPGDLGNVLTAVTDLEGVPMAGLTISATASTGVLGVFADQGDGTYTATYGAPSTEQRAVLSIRTDGFACGVDIGCEVRCPGFGIYMTPSPMQPGEDGSLTVFATDPGGTPLAGLPLEITVSAGDLDGLTDSGDGIYEADCTAPASPATVTVTVTHPASGCTAPMAFEVMTCSSALVVESETIATATNVEWCGDVVIGPGVTVNGTGSLMVQSGGRIEIVNGFAVDSGASVTFALQP